MLFESLGLRPFAQWLSRHDWCCAVPVNYLKSESNFEWIFLPLEKEFRVALRFSFVVSCQRFGSSWPSSWKKFIKIIFKGELNKISTLLGALHILEWENLLWRTLPVAVCITKLIVSFYQSRMKMTMNRSEVKTEFFQERLHSSLKHEQNEIIQSENV